MGNFCLCDIAGFSAYGNYRNRKFEKIFPEQSDFVDDWNHSIFVADNPLDEKLVRLTYQNLYGYYVGSTIATSNEYHFKQKLFSIMVTYGPEWMRKKELQERARTLTDEEIFQGYKTVYNHAINPADAPGTQTLDEIQYIDQQNTANFKKEPIRGINELHALLREDYTKEYMRHFKKLFLTVVAPEAPLYYCDMEEEE